MKKMKFAVINKYYVEQKRIEDNEVNKDYIYDTYEEAVKVANENLEKRDISRAIIKKEIINLLPSSLNNKLTSYSKLYSYNVLQYTRGLQGFTFNLAIIVWNKETGEMVIKSLEKEHIDNLLNIMPSLSFMRDIISSFEKHFKNLKEHKDFSGLRNYIVNYSRHYPLEHNFKFELLNLYNAGANEMDSEKLSINNVASSLFESYIGDMFKE